MEVAIQSPVEPISLPVTDSSHVGEARRTAAAMGRALAFNETVAGELAIIVTELANNLHRHATQGEMILQPLQSINELGVEVLAVDRGPGVANVGDALRDGYSTGGTSGTGLGAVRRMAHEFDLYTEPGRGTVVLARLWADQVATPGPLQVRAVCLPLAGEVACGDHWAMHEDAQAGRTVILVADGLGHGDSAAKASRRALEIFDEAASRAPGQIVEQLHAGLRGTRGAAVAVAEVLRGPGVLNFAGLGNISAILHSGLTTRSLVSHNGTAGVEARRMQEFQYPWSAETLLVMHSDGLAQHWSLPSHRGLMMRDPSTIAAILYRDHRRVRDDVTALVAREKPAE